MHTSDLRFQVQNLTRVEGEGSLQLTVRDGLVSEARLQIFEAPRYFEALVAGRTPNEVIDIVSRRFIGTLDEGMRVSFETEPDKRGKGRKAVNLQLAS